MGGLVDLIIVSKDRVDQSMFNSDRHRTIVLYKTAICPLYFPVALAVLFSGFPVEKKNDSDPDYYKLAFDMLSPLGEYFQVQDDYLNFSRSLSYSGRSGPTWTTSIHGHQHGPEIRKLNVARGPRR